MDTIQLKGFKGIKLGDAQKDVDEIRYIAIDRIETSRFQPRKVFNEDEIKSLAASIKDNGVLQPVIVRVKNKTLFELIAGERRWRASKLAGLKEMPVIVKDLDDREVRLIALVENLQREDLNAIEQALAYKELIDEHQLTHHDVAKAVGKSRTTITNSIRLLGLDPEVIVLLEKKQLEMGHARALLTLPEKLQRQAANRIVEDALSVRQAENLVGALLKNKEKSSEPANYIEKTLIKGWVDALEEAVGKPVQIKADKLGGAKITITVADKASMDAFITQMKERS